MNPDQLFAKPDCRLVSKPEPPLNLDRKEPTLFVRVATWQRDSHGLFDYESTNTDKVSFKTRDHGFITRRSTQGEASVVTYEDKSQNAIV